MSLSALSATAAEASSNKSATVTSMSEGSNGTVLVDNGKTVYTLAGSAKCNSSCQKIWPPVTVSAHSKPKAGSGVQKSELGVTTTGGMHKVTYEGKPLYWFSGDKSKGQATGNITDQWGKWTDVVVKPATSSTGSGAPMTPTTSPSSGGGSGGGNAGSGGASF